MASILSFPNITPETLEFGIQYNTQVATSQLNGLVQTVELPGARWKGSMSFTDMTPAESAKLKTFLLQLRGSSGRFFFGDLSHTQPFNDVSGELTANGTSTRSVLNVTYNSGSEFLIPGDYISVGISSDSKRELKMIVDTQNTGGLSYDLTIEPLIRRTDYIGLVLDYIFPTGIFMLTSDDQAYWNIRSKALLSDITLEFIEVYYYS